MNRSRSLTALVVIGTLAALNGLALSPLWLFGGGETFAETAASWPFHTSQRLAWVLFTAMAVVVPSLLGAGTRRDAPPWAGPLVQVALSAQAATAFAMGFVAPWLAEVSPPLLDAEDGGMFLLAMTGVWVGFLVAMVVFAVVLARTGGIGAPAVAMILVGSLLTPGIGPLGAGLAGAGLALAARRRLRAAQPPTPASTVDSPAVTV